MTHPLQRLTLALVIAAELTSAAWARGIRPPPPLTVSEWAQLHRVVTAPTPAPGPWRNERTPYLAGIMDCLSPSSAAREIDVMKGTQMGVTEAAVNVVGYYSHQAPTSGLIVLPSKDLAAEWSRIRLTGLFENTPVLANLLAPSRNRHTRSNTLYSKRLAGGAGTWKIAWSSSGKVLRSTPAAIIIADEVDGFVITIPGEGEPVELLRKRFTNFARGKFLRISSPIDRTSSRIERGFLEGDQRYYFVPCPTCGHRQRLTFAGLHWEKGRPGTVTCTCIACQQAIPEHHKKAMLAAGIWVATRDEPKIAAEGFADSREVAHILERMQDELHPSFHLPSLYSPWFKWKTLAADYDASRNNPEKHKVFVTTTLGETWVDRGEAPDWEKIAARRQPYEEGVVPRGVLFLVAGADVQEDRIEVEVVGYGRGKESWSVAYMVLMGDTNTAGPWKMLEEVLARDWLTADGGEEKTLPIAVLAVDSGYRSSKVYEFARRHPQAAHGPAGSRIAKMRTVVPTKGGGDAFRVISKVSNADAARKRRGIKIVTIGTPAVKQDIYDCLRLPEPDEGQSYPPGYCHFPAGYADDYFKGLCSESRITRSSGKSEWVKDPNVRNEPLDIRGCARAAAALFGLDRFTDRVWLQLGWNPNLVAVKGVPIEGAQPKPAVSAVKAKPPQAPPAKSASFRPVVGKIRL